MDTSGAVVFDDVEKLKKAIAEEEKKRPPELKEEPINAQVGYVFPPNYLPREHAHPATLLQNLQQRFHLSLDDSKYRGLIRDQRVGPEDILKYILDQGDEWNFRHGTLQLEQPARTTTVNQLIMSTEMIAASAVGSTFEADWVAQKSTEILWTSAGVQRIWSQLTSFAQLRWCKTSTRVSLGFNLVDLFDPRFRQFVTDRIANSDGFAYAMGHQPVDKDLLRVNKGDLVVVPFVSDIAMQISIFNRVSGRNERCGIQFDVQARHEANSGNVVITTELDSERHTQFIKALKSVFQK